MDFSTLLIEKNAHIYGIVGNYGSGKTEIAVNFTLLLKSYRESVTIVDLDIVNPYFRCREARDMIRSRNINFVLPSEEQIWADLPIIVPEIKGHIQHPNGSVVLDVGGDDVGARVLGGFRRLFEGIPYELWMVINISRPFTENLSGCLNMIKKIESASKLSITGIISNSHLMEYTTPELVYQGYELSRELSEALHIPIAFLTVEKHLVSQLDRKRITCPILELDRYLLPPWKVRV